MNNLDLTKLKLPALDNNKNVFEQQVANLIQSSNSYEDCIDKVIFHFKNIVPDYDDLKNDENYQGILDDFENEIKNYIRALFPKDNSNIQEEILNQTNNHYLEKQVSSVHDLIKSINKKLRGKHEIQPRNFVTNKLFSINEIKPGEIVEFKGELNNFDEKNKEEYLSEIADIGYYLMQLTYFDESYLDDLYDFLNVTKISPKEVVDLINIKYKYRLSNQKNKDKENNLINQYWESTDNRSLEIDVVFIEKYIDKFVREKGEVLRNKKLPIWDVMPRIVKELNENKVLVIKAETGSGKTTQIPQGLLEAGFGKHGTIRTTENRVVIAREVGNRVAEEVGCNTGDIVGYLTGNDKKVSDNTKIIYETTGVLKNVLKSNQLLEGINVVMIDEFDERTLDQDIVIALIKKAQDSGSNVKLILTSATGNLENLKDHFNCNHIEAKGRPFPVETVWQENEIPSYRLVDNIAKKIEELDAVYPEDEDILVFLPGKADIEEAIKEVENLKLQNILLLPFHAELDKESMHRVFRPSGGRKIIFATDLAQRGLTLGKLHVVDACLQKRVEYDPGKDCQSLITMKISKSDSMQRRGRAGRIAPGTYHPMITKDEYEKLNDETPPEILRMPLRSVILQIKAMGYSREGDKLDFITNPKKNNWKEAKNQLRLLGLLNCENEEILSEKGKLVATLPCDPRDGVSIIKSLELGCERDMSIITAIKMAKNLLIRPRKEEERDKAKTIQNKFMTSENSDLINLLNAYKEAEKNNGNYQWFRENFISYKAFTEIRNNIRIIEQIVRQIKQRKESCKKIENNYSNEDKILLSIYEGNKDKTYSHCTNQYYGSDKYDDEDTYSLGKDSRCKQTKIIANELIEIQTRRGSLKLITKATKYPTELLKTIFEQEKTRLSQILPSKIVIRNTDCQIDYTYTEDGLIKINCDIPAKLCLEISEQEIKNKIDLSKMQNHRVQYNYNISYNNIRDNELADRFFDDFEEALTFSAEKVKENINPSQIEINGSIFDVNYFNFPSKIFLLCSVENKLSDKQNITTNDLSEVRNKFYLKKNTKIIFTIKIDKNANINFELDEKESLKEKIENEYNLKYARIFLENKNTENESEFFWTVDNILNSKKNNFTLATDKEKKIILGDELLSFKREDLLESITGNQSSSDDISFEIKIEQKIQSKLDDFSNEIKTELNKYEEYKISKLFPNKSCSNVLRLLGNYPLDKIKPDEQSTNLSKIIYDFIQNEINGGLEEKIQKRKGIFLQMLDLKKKEYIEEFNNPDNNFIKKRFKILFLDEKNLVNNIFNNCKWDNDWNQYMDSIGIDIQKDAKEMLDNIKLKIQNELDVNINFQLTSIFFDKDNKDRWENCLYDMDIYGMKNIFNYIQTEDSIDDQQEEKINKILNEYKQILKIQMEKYNKSKKEIGENNLLLKNLQSISESPNNTDNAKKKIEWIIAVYSFQENLGKATKILEQQKKLIKEYSEFEIDHYIIDVFNGDIEAIKKLCDSLKKIGKISKNNEHEFFCGRGRKQDVYSLFKIEYGRIDVNDIDWFVNSYLFESNQSIQKIESSNVPSEEDTSEPEHISELGCKLKEAFEKRKKKE